MTDDALPPDGSIPTQAGGSTPCVLRRLGRRLRMSLRMHHLLFPVLFLAFALVACVLIAVLALWQESTAYQNELASVRGQHRHGDQVAVLAIIVAVVSLAAAAFMSWLIASFLARPVRQLAHTAEAVLAGNEDVSAPAFRGWEPLEIQFLGQTFNTMLADLRRKHAAAALALREAQTSNLAKTEFLANMSHEIRTPLNDVVGMIELLRLSDLSAEQRRYVDAATQSAQTLLLLIDDILDVSKIEAGKLELEHAPFHLPSLVHEVRALFADQARARGFMLSASIPDELNVSLLGDARRLSQILTNLVGNAVKFTHEGGVTIGISRLEDRDSSLHLRFTVTDTGIGVPPGRQQDIFDAFSQADSATTRRDGGTGLGLSIARQLCHAMGGEIGVESVVGQGSTFWFTVALDKQPPMAGLPPSPNPSIAAAQHELQAALNSTGRDTIRILLVEDNTANLRVTEALLEALGCSVSTARNGLEAVAAYREGSFDLVLMDCQMPEMDGYDAARAIRRLETNQGRTTPIVALTAHAHDDSRDMSLEAGMNDHLTKPFTMAALTEKLVRWLGGGVRR